jgi:DNA-3-methyladenine glycosylase I
VCASAQDRASRWCWRTRRHDDESATTVKVMAGVGVPAQLATVVRAADGVTRCRWATETGRDLTGYHDHEWGIPTHDETALFEMLALTYFENGLSWVTVFDKRANLRKAFHGFIPAAVAAMTPGDVERLMADTAIIRNRQKIEATLHNARLLSKYSLSQLAWQYQPREQHRLRSWADGRMVSPESRQLSLALREAGFRLVGPVVAHSFMHTAGIQNGHFEGCFRAAG